MGFCGVPGYVRIEREKEEEKRCRENKDKWLQTWADNLKRESHPQKTEKTPENNKKANHRVSALTARPGEVVKVKGAGVSIEIKIHY